MKRALIVLTSHSVLGSTGKPTGWYLPEVTHVYWPLVEAGFEIDFASPLGGTAPMDPGSKKLDDPANKRFFDDAAALAKVGATIAGEDVDAKQYQVVFFAGGHGTMWDLADSPALARVAAAVYEQGGYVAAVCHGPAGLVNVKLSNGKYLVDGKDVAGFTNEEEAAVGLTGIVPYLLESTLVERGARFHGGKKWSDTVVVSERLVTGQNPQSAASLGKKLAALAGGAV